MGDGFESIVGAGNVERPSALRLAGARVAAIVRPANALEVAACLRSASDAGTPIVAYGSGSRQHFGNPLDATECVQLELGRLAQKIEVDGDEGIATLDAGVRIGELTRLASACGKTSVVGDLPADGTFGGALAADPFGPDWTLDRRLRNEVLGVEIALANGELARAGGRVVKNVTGFDLVRLYCGSCGTLGVLTSATLRLRAAPECERLVRAYFPTLEAGVAAFARASVSADATAAALRPDGEGAGLFCRFTGDTRGTALQAARVPGDEVPLEAWARLRAERAAPPGASRARVRLSARRSDVTELCREVERVAGAGAVRGVYPLAGSLVADVDDALLPKLVDTARDLDAAFHAERAPGAGPAPCDVFGAAPDALSLMRTVKSRFDPRRVLAPGRFIGGI
jgi:glycolate oxidase FAD binding subunit